MIFHALCRGNGFIQRSIQPRLQAIHATCLQIHSEEKYNAEKYPTYWRSGSDLEAILWKKTDNIAELIVFFCFF